MIEPSAENKPTEGSLPLIRYVFTPSTLPHEMIISKSPVG
jgi:hypothetical protein